MSPDLVAACVYGVKLADLTTPLQPHQQRVLDKLRASHGVLVAHGLGSGKTLTSLGAIKQEGLPTDVVTPAPLVQNYAKEIEKHAPGGLGQPLRVRSYEKATRDKDLDPSGLVVLDEAHRGRNPGTAINKEVLQRAATARARLLLTGTPVFNDPYDAAVLLNTAAGKDVLPASPTAFRQQFVGQAMKPVGLWGRLRGVEAAPIDVLKNQDQLVNAAKGYVDVHPSGGKDFPRRTEESVNVPMSKKQWDLYRYHEDGLPWYLSYKIRHGLPMNKAESSQLNAFSTALRQTSNTPRPYVESMSDTDEDEHTPKVRRAVDELLKRRQADPNFRGVVYSNYLDAGLSPYARALQAHGVPHAMFTGSVNPKDRRRFVDEYNTGKTPVMLVSGAGTEGLDLKGTKLIQELEPHWNNARMQQVEGRGIRYQSHAHLPQDERQVHVQKYYSTSPENLLHKLHIAHRPGTIDHYIRDRAKDKDLLAHQIMAALQRASDAGPLEPPMKTASSSMMPTLRASMMTAATQAPSGFGALARRALQDNLATMAPGAKGVVAQAANAQVSHLSNPVFPRPGRMPTGLESIYNAMGQMYGKEAALRAFGLR